MSLVLRLFSERVFLELPYSLEEQVRQFYQPCVEPVWTGPVKATIRVEAGRLICSGSALEKFIDPKTASLMRVEKVLLKLCERLHVENCLLHAGGVIYRGQLLLFLGSSNSGKSSFCFQAIQRGAQYLSDDALAMVESRLWGLARSIRFNEEKISELKTKHYLEEMNTTLYQQPELKSPMVYPFYDGAQLNLASVSLSNTPAIIIKLERGESRLKKISEFEAIVHLHESAILTGKEYPGGLKIESAYQLTWQNPEESWELLSHEIFPSGL